MQSRLVLKKEEKGSLEYAAWRSLADCYKTIYAHVISDLRQYGLTPPQYTVLRVAGMSQSGRITMSELGKQMVVTFANVTTIVDNLERRNYARRVRDSKDRRVIMVELTAKGNDLFRSIFRAHRKQVARLMGTLNESELTNLITYTKKVMKEAPIRE